ncbi:MAG: hypothetical protein U9O94_02380 [Nanoarchaeota archaeon]|nr:hypothetical protein [Nanoarchaeota archaeon]
MANMAKTEKLKMTKEERMALASPNNFLTYAKLSLKLRAKNGQILPLTLNKAQLYLHKKLEEQRKKTGKVRALVLKGRQQGCSTYIGARFYHRTTNTLGQRCFIMAHEAEATLNLFDMVSRYHEYCPPEVKAKASTDNAKELTFNDMDSGYKVATAGSKQSGRSQTIQLMHGSETGFWENAKEIFAGALQAVPDCAGSEVILESTANGMGNEFYTKCMEAMRGESDYQLVFLAWFWQDEYKKETPEGFLLTTEEQEYKDTYKLTDEQIYWRRLKTKDLGDWKFKQEYPANPIEAFQVDTDEVFISAQTILKARKTVIDSTNSVAPLLLGVDPAWKGKDRTAIAYRRGRKIEKVDVLNTNDTMEVVGNIVKIIKEHSPAKVFLDVIGIGAGVYDRLCELGYESLVIAVNAGATADDKDKYFNLRAEMWGRFKDWLDDELPVDIPDEDVLQADIMKPLYSYDSNTRIKLEKKEDMRKRGISSPDLADAICLTFAYLLGMEVIDSGNMATYKPKVKNKRPKFIKR